MSKHLLLITIGPVQDFIVAARRTRDLWYGSHLLSELSRAVAKAVAEAGGTLIFPALAVGDEELESCEQPSREDGRPPLSVANKILAVVGDEPRAVAEAARAALLERLDGVDAPPKDGVARRVKKDCRGLLAPDIDAVWREQIHTLPEFYAGWAPLNGGYRAAREAVEQAVAGRKALREFGPWSETRGGVPKSSLDGARETVLAEPGQREKRLVQRYRIGDGEQLDAVGLIKRAGGEPDQFVPITTVALAPWLALAKELSPQNYGLLQQACRDLGLPRVVRRDLPCAAFGFDASLVLTDRLKPLFKERGLGDPAEFEKEYVRPLLGHRRLPEPYPYVACLVADGDHMGLALSRMDDAGQHRDFSRRLGEFPGEARRIVEREHQGALVYSGGDDVLAFLPVATALSCAKRLHEAFGELMGDFGGEKPPTLSVGVAFAHLLEGMGDLLEFGRQAERLAKVKRNSLAVVVDKRSGGQHTWAAPWPSKPVEQVEAGRECLAGPLSTKKVHEIAARWRACPLPEKLGADDQAAWRTVLEGEVERILGRTHGGEQTLTPADVGMAWRETSDYDELHGEVRDWIHRMRVAMMVEAGTPVPKEERP